MTEEPLVQKGALFADLQLSQFFQIIAIGALVGLLNYGLINVLGAYVFKPVVCSSDSGLCSAANQYAVVLASLLTAAVALFGFVKLRVYRPLLVVIAATTSLWGLGSLLLNLPWYTALGFSAILYTFAYVLYAWAARIRLFWLAVVVLVVLIVATRLVLMR
jgi:hypothetical protein